MEKENKQLTLFDLEMVFNQAKGMDASYIGVKIQMQGFDEPEIIINPKENFDAKLEYYKKAYNEDLTLKAFNGIEIVGFEYGNSFQEIQDWLIDNK